MTWTVLIIGLGNIAFKYDLNKPDNIIQTHARAFAVHPDFQLIGGVDPDGINRDLFQTEYSAVTYDSISEACGLLKPDIVVISSPTRVHLENLKEVLSSCKPNVVLMEKPAVYTKADSQAMLALSTGANVTVLMNLIRRADPSVNEIKSMIDAGEIATPCKGVVWYSKGLIHSACHFIDLLSWWLGEPKNIELIDAGRKIHASDIEADLRIYFGESSIYFLAKKSEEFNYYNIELLAKNGRLSFGGGVGGITWQEKSPESAGLQPAMRDIKNELNQYQLNVAKEIGLYLRKMKCSMPTLTEHLSTMNAVYGFAEAWAGT